MRTRSRYFVTRKWVFDRAARTRANKAHRLIAGAHDFLMRTATITDGIDMDLASWDALQLLDRANRTVGACADDAQREARLRDEGIIGGRC